MSASRRIRWFPTPEQEALMHEMAAAGKGVNEIQRAVKVGATATIRRWAQDNGVVIAFAGNRRWEVADDANLVRLFHRLGDLDALTREIPTRTKHAIQVRLNTLGLQITAPRPRKDPSRRFKQSEATHGGFSIPRDTYPPGHPDTWALLLANSPSIAGAPYEPNRWA
jgi:hypothetical protein